MNRLAVLGLALLACSAQPSGSSTTASVSPTSVACKLAVIDWGSPGQAGFLTLPGGAFTAASDAASGIYYDKPLKRWVLGGPPGLDGSDVWLSSSSLTRSWAIFHFSPRGGLEPVATFTDHPVTVAGPCA